MPSKFPVILLVYAFIVGSSGLTIKIPAGNYFIKKNLHLLPVSFSSAFHLKLTFSIHLSACRLPHVHCKLSLPVAMTVKTNNMSWI